MATIQTLAPNLTQARGLSNWQQAVNYAGYAPPNSDIRSTNRSQEHQYVHTKSKSLLNADRARSASLKTERMQAAGISGQPANKAANAVKLEVMTREQTQMQLRVDFFAHYAGELDRIAQEIPSRFWGPAGPTMDSFKQEALQRIKQIAVGHFPRGELVDATGMRKEILKASIEAEKYLLETRAKFSDDLDRAPQLFDNKGKVTIIRPAPSLENLALRGGGTKGIGYIGQVRALESQGVIKQLRHVAGTSAGALTASLIAGGLSAETFAKVSSSRSPLEMFRRKDNAVDTQFGKGYFEASAIVSLIDESIKDSIKELLGEDPPPDLNALSPKDQQELRDLASAPVSTPVTFRHLQLLAGIRPERFKNLTLAVFDTTENRTKHIGADNHPDWPIGETARMSMSIPIIFKGVQGPDGHFYQDGGLGSNMPSEVFVRPDASKVPPDLMKDESGLSKWKPQMQEHVDGLIDSVDKGRPLTDAEQAGMSAKTLLISFDEKGKFYEIANRGVLFNQPKGLRKLFGVNASAAAADRLKVYSAGPNAMPAFHGNLDTVTLSASERTLDLVKLFSEAKALEQVRQQLPTDRATFEVQDNLDAALKTLTTDELELLRQACWDRIAGDREIEEGNKWGEVPDRTLLEGIEHEQSSRNAALPMSDRQLRAVQGLRNTAVQVQAELAAARWVHVPSQQTPRQVQLLSTESQGTKALQALILREHLVRTMDKGIQDLQSDLPRPEEPEALQKIQQDGQEPIDNQRQQAVRQLRQVIARLKEPISADDLEPETLVRWCQSAKVIEDQPAGTPWIELSAQIEEKVGGLQPRAEQAQRSDSAIGLRASMTMPRAMGSPVMGQDGAQRRAKEGIEAAESAGVKKSSSWFTRIAKVTAGLLGMAGAVALGVLFPPAAPLIYVGALAATAGIARALQDGPIGHRNRQAVEEELEAHRRAAQVNDRV